MQNRGATVLLVAPEGTKGVHLPYVVPNHEEFDPISAIQSFYVMVESLSRARGFDPDQPPHLSKVTQTR